MFCKNLNENQLKMTSQNINFSSHKQIYTSIYASMLRMMGALVRATEMIGMYHYRFARQHFRTSESKHLSYGGINGHGANRNHNSHRWLKQLRHHASSFAPMMCSNICRKEGGHPRRASAEKEARRPEGSKAAKKIKKGGSYQGS